MHNEFDRELFSASGTVTTGALPVPSLSVSVSGTSISVDVTIPSGIEKVRLDHDFSENFDDNPQTQDVNRSIGSDVSQPETVNVSLPNRNPSTTYHFRTASEFLGESSDYSPIESITTGSYLAPYDVSAASATSPDVGQVRLRWRWGGSYRGEWANITRYQQGVQGYVELGSIFRENDPRDLDSREERSEVIFENQPSGEQWIYVVTPWNQNANPGGSDTDSVLID